ncbi:choline kinase family protein [Zobellella maritima]|uniref:choline kinase family protein n=1 Tax=Zobellella maritima TaxID=2059725 RepID=UPI000E308639|nr:choline kinase family protein [Zobellella maritima]
MDNSRLLALLPAAFDGKLTPLAGGLTNRSWRLDTGNGSYWLRLGCPRPEWLGIDRQRELIAHRTAANAGLAPAIRFAEPTRGILVLDWLDEPSWSYLEPAAAATLAGVLARLHGLSPSLPPLELRGQLARYLSRLRRLPAEIAAVLPLFERPALNLPFTPVFCHNDLSGTNLLGPRPWLIDWEYAAMGDAAFELAVVWDGFGLDEQGGRRLVERYAEAGGDISLARVRARLPWVQLITALWAALQWQQTDDIRYRDYQRQATARLPDSLNRIGLSA